MKCQFCHQDVDNPCHNTQQMQERAASHVDHCEHALKDREGAAAGAHRRDVQSGG